MESGERNKDRVKNQKEKNKCTLVWVCLYEPMIAAKAYKYLYWASGEFWMD